MFEVRCYKLILLYKDALNRFRVTLKTLLQCIQFIQMHEDIKKHHCLQHW